ncbi:unnamed protein product, partial [Mesorhabditis belari]|uniref:Uncharacterized protein n=1 Tax=Mesorhabditis belari TaxID=2138241 RepID=A0AAF3ES57_9BILA
MRLLCINLSILCAYCLQRESPTKRNLKGANKPKPMSPDEWLRKLEAGGQDEDDDREEEPLRIGSQRKRPKKCGL